MPRARAGGGRYTSLTMRRLLLLGLFLLPVAGCAAGVVMVRPGADKVTIVEKPPQARSVGPILAVHGKGCGLFAKRGNRDGALAVLKNLAVAKGADRVLIKAEHGPYTDGYCKRQSYTIEAIGYAQAAATVRAP